MDKIQALIVDDDRDTAEFFSTILSIVGFECEIANSGKAALVRLSASEPDIVLLDMRLGLEVSGVDILYQIRSNPRFDKTRVVVVTAYPSMAEQINNLADLILLKPVEVDQLSTILSRLSSVEIKTYLFRDPLTELYSLEFFMTRLEHAFERTRRQPELLFATMVIAPEVILEEEGEGLHDEDWGQILKATAERLKTNYRPTDSFARLDRERIVALFEDLKHPDDVEVIIRRLHQVLAEPFDAGGRSATLMLKVGVILNKPRYKSAEAILEAAIEALEISSQQNN